MNKKKILGYIVGIIGGYLISHYLISPLDLFHKSLFHQLKVVNSSN